MKIIKLFLIIMFIASFAYADNPWDYVEELTIELEASNELIKQLKEENINLEKQLTETTNELENSTNVIIFLRDQLIRTQEELVHFREKYEEQLIISNERNKFLGLGIGATYPSGGEAIITVTIPFFQMISFYGRFGLQASSNIINAGAGLIISF